MLGVEPSNQEKVPMVEGRGNKSRSDEAKNLGQFVVVVIHEEDGGDHKLAL